MPRGAWARRAARRAAPGPAPLRYASGRCRVPRRPPRRPDRGHPAAWLRAMAPARPLPSKHARSPAQSTANGTDPTPAALAQRGEPSPLAPCPWRGWKRASNRMIFPPGKMPNFRLGMAPSWRSTLPPILSPPPRRCPLSLALHTAATPAPPLSRDPLPSCSASLLPLVFPPCLVVCPSLPTARTRRSAGYCSWGNDSGGTRVVDIAFAVAYNREGQAPANQLIDPAIGSNPCPL